MLSMSTHSPSGHDAGFATTLLSYTPSSRIDVPNHQGCFPACVVSLYHVELWMGHVHMADYVGETQHEAIWFLCVTLKHVCPYFPSLYTSCCVCLLYRRGGKNCFTNLELHVWTFLGMP